MSAELPFAARRVAILTGRADPARTGLAPVQAAFLAAVTPSDAEALDTGFPFLPQALPEGPVPLPLAAWRNARQWRAARRGTIAHGDRIGALLRASGRLAIVTASCGLDILAACWPGPAPRTTLVLALGPVTRDRPHLPGARVVTLVGRRDLISRAMHRAPTDHAPPCGHMGYWTCPETRTLVADLLAAHMGTGRRTA